MADITKLLGGPFIPPPARPDLPPESQLLDSIAAAGLKPPSSVVLDGRLHRFAAGAGREKTGWYIAYGDGVPAGKFGCWRQGIEVSWRAEGGRDWTPAEELEHARRMAEAKALRDAEAAKRHEVAASVVATIWESLPGAPADHPYLVRKGVKPHGAKVTGDGRLVVPLMDADGEIMSLQYINADGGKLYHSGAPTGGAFNVLGVLSADAITYVVEGFATGATVHEVMGAATVVTYSASNLVAVTETLRGLLGEAANLVIVADNDKSQVGQRYAEQACAKHGARYVVPPIPGDANDYVQAGRDLAALLTPTAGDWLVQADDFASQPAPIAWLVKGWLQQNALMMVHGPSGSGKTFVVLDWCARMASGLEEWHGVKVKPGAVVYLAGEGHHGLRGRVAAWKVRNRVDRMAMWLSRTGCDLNTVPGLQKAVDAVRSLPTAPSLIVVDTLHRFLDGDENSSVDAKTMLDACAGLMHEFGCSVLLVHHTGHNSDDRARGSSAWRGALDIEIGVSPAKDDKPIVITQRKNKDAEQADPVHCTLEVVPIPGWVDEDGEPVTSAVAVPADAPSAPEKKETGLTKHRKTLERAWWASGREQRDRMPYVSRSALRDFLAENMGWADGTINQHLKPSAPGRMVHDLLNADFISPHEHGWVISDPIRSGTLLMETK